MRVLFVDFTTGLKTVDDLQTGGRGGMVTSLFRVPDALSQLGIQTSVFSDILQGGQSGNTAWYTVEEYETVANVAWDFIVFNRGIGNLLPEFKAKHRILWTHDLVHGGFARNPQHLKALSATVFMSKYAERIWRLYYRQIGRSFIIPNGVDKDIFYPREKDLDYMIFISAPNRGLKRLPPIFETVRQRFNGRPLRLVAYSNMKVLHPKDTSVNDGADDIYSPIYEDAIAQGVDVRDPVPQPKLAEELGRAGMMVLPTGYPEICSNAVLQSLASGTPIITTGNMGSACEWVKHRWNGILTKTHLEDYAIHMMEIMRGVAEVLADEKLHRRLIRNAAKTKGIYTWKEIGKRWKTMLDRLY